MIRQVEKKFPVKTTRSPECRIYRIQSICSTNYNYFTSIIQSIHEGKKSRHNGAKREFSKKKNKKNYREHCNSFLFQIATFIASNMLNWNKPHNCFKSQIKKESFDLICIRFSITTPVKNYKFKLPPLYLLGNENSANYLLCLWKDLFH